VNKVGIFKLLDGLSAETSGGLLIALPEDKAKAFCEEIEQLDGYPAWIIGKVVDRSDDQQNVSRIQFRFVRGVSVSDHTSTGSCHCP